MLILSGASIQGVLTPQQKVLEASTVKMPYLGIAILLFLLAFIISRFHLPVLVSIDETAGGDQESAHDSIWHYSHLILGAVGIFVYVGAEVSIGSFLVNYFSQPDIGGLSERTAAGYVSLYWGGAMVGRFIGSGLVRKVNAGIVLGCAAVAACALVVTSMLTSGHLAMWTIILVGLFNSVMFPTIFTLGIDGLGKLTGKGSGLLVMAIVGGAVLPIIQGWLADSIGIHHAFFIPALCYVYVLYYGFRGSRHKPTTAQLAEPVAAS
jgi:FHS family L-fucose permease-like MFS transporter